MVQNDGDSCYGDQSGRVCTSVVLIFGCPSDIQSDEFVGPNAGTISGLNSMSEGFQLHIQ